MICYLIVVKYIAVKLASICEFICNECVNYSLLCLLLDYGYYSRWLSALGRIETQKTGKAVE